VLVRSNPQAAMIRDALAAVGIPAVINGAGSVFGTATAGEWLRLLEALERPTSATRAASVALTVFLGWSAREVALASDSDWEIIHARLHQWAGLLRRRGVASLLEAVSRSEGMPGRVLRRPLGERELTDVRHIGQLLHGVATSEQLGVTALAAWLRQRIAEADRDTGNEERSRRLESDAEAVQVLTVHRSKGLEFPIVYYPYLWDAWWIAPEDPPIYHDADNGNERTIDVGGKEAPGFEDHWKCYVSDLRGEELRLVYVALTRAQHQAVLWWAGSSRDSALGRLLFSRDSDGNVSAQAARIPPNEKVAAYFSDLALHHHVDISVEYSDGGTGDRWNGPARAPADLTAARFERVLDEQWRRTSYSGITAGAHEGVVAHVASEADDEMVSDETEAALPGTAALRASTAAQPIANAEWSAPVPLALMPGGREVGTLVHSVLEAVDFASADLDAALLAAVTSERRRQHLDIGNPTSVAAGIRAAIETPLGPLFGDSRLRDIATGDRVNEMTFELPLVGGDTPMASLDTSAVASVFRRFVPAGDHLSGYADRLEDPTLVGDLRGYLTGSLDLVVRIRDTDESRAAVSRFVVVDYKTNRLAPAGEELTSWHYRPEALAEEMQRAHYPLQAVLYLVALHRYLRWRVAGYDPECHLAGVAYLFVRGMSGPDTPRIGPQPCGVFAWRPPRGFVEALSDLLDQGKLAP
jgi:exodeoxyribonuclease V beta subunit